MPDLNVCDCEGVFGGPVPISKSYIMIQLLLYLVVIEGCRVLDQSKHCSSSLDPVNNSDRNIALH